MDKVKKQMIPSLKARLIQSGSRRRINIPRFSKKVSMLATDSPPACRRATLWAKTKPAKKIKVGAQIWVIQRVRNCATGITDPGTYQSSRVSDVASGIEYMGGMI